MKTITLTTGKGYYTKNGEVKGYFDLTPGAHQIADEFEFVESATLPPIVPDTIPPEVIQENLIFQKQQEILREQAVTALKAEGKLPGNFDPKPKGK